jgi:branched-chain amino acid transport system substrate-binding protein
VVPEGALSNDQVILAGFMAPVRGPFAAHGTPLRDGAALALDEIEAWTRGVPGLEGGSPTHLAMLVCHDTPERGGSRTRAVDVARHLVDTVGVSAIIGPSKVPSTAIDVITDVTSPAGVLTISPSATQPSIPEIDKLGLFWRTVPSDTIQVEAWRYLSLGMIQRLWHDGDDTVLKEPEEPRVVYVGRADSYGAGLLQLAREKLVSNAPVFTYDLEGRVAWDALADQVVDERPLFLYAFSTLEFVTELLPRIEQRWGQTWGMAPRPFYLLLDGTRVEALLPRIDQNPDLARRIIGTAPGVRTSGVFEGFRARLTQAFGEEPGSLAEFAYDAAYLLAYAVAGAKKQRPTGFELAAALSTLTCGDGVRVEAGPDALSSGFGAASAGVCFNFEGASGPLDFDSASGEAPNDIAAWCAVRDPSGRPFPLLGQGVYYDVKTPGVVGWVEGEYLPFCSAP